MTPDALRAAIASARLRPRMYAQTAEHLASMLYGMIAGAAPDAVDIGPAWGAAYAPANVHAPTDAEVCDAAEATVAALWPQGDAPAGDECAAYSAAPLDTPMPPAFVAALASLSPAEAGALDLDAIEARERAALAAAREALRGGYDAAGFDRLTREERRADDALRLVAALRAERDAAERLRANIADRERIAAGVRELFAHVDADDAPPPVAQPEPLPRIKCPFCDGDGSCRARDPRSGCVAVAPCVACSGSGEVPTVAAPTFSPETLATFFRNAEVLSGAYVDARAEIDRLTAEVERLRAQLAAAQPVLMLDAIRRGPPSTWVRCLACAGTGVEVDAEGEGVSCEPCRGTGRHPPPDPAEATDDVFEEFARAWAADTDLCPKCGALDLGRACEKSAGTVAGEAFAVEHPYAAGALMGGVAKREDVTSG